MGKSLADLFTPETDIVIKASELFAVMQEATKAELLLNAAKCEVPHTYARQIATGIKEDAPTPQTPVSVNIDLSSGKDSSGAAGADDGAAGQAERAENDADGDPVYYWTADPSAANTTYFCRFTDNGDSYYHGASYEGGVAPLFVIE